MKKIYLIPLFVLTINLSYSQKKDDLVNLADSLYNTKNFLESGKLFDEAFQKIEGDQHSYYTAACSWALTGESKKAINYLYKSIDKGWVNIDWMKKDSDLLSLHDLAGWDSLLIQLQQRIEIKERNINKPLKEELEQIYMKDQTLRQIIPCVEEKFGKDSKEVKYFWNMINQQDSINEVKVLAIIDKFGWPGKSLVGAKANKTVWLVIQHSSLTTQEKYLPIMRQSVEGGESEGSQLSLLEDRILIGKGEKQIYGSQLKQNENGEYELYPVEDPENLNARRLKIGLGPIEEYLKHWNIEYKGK